MTKHDIPFNRPYLTGNERDYIAQAHADLMLSGDGPLTAWCERWLERETTCRRALLTHSCTAALEMAAILADLGPGDEVIMPSYTFVSTANAFVLRGAVPVFVDIRADTLNIDEALVEAAITPRTRAIVVVHYAGVGCDMDAIGAIAARHGLVVIEDAAQGICASYRGKPLGSFGALAALSFHETKNITCGEGGALLVNDPALVPRAEIVREKGTNRKQFMDGLVDKYTWVDVGSSFLPGEISAGFLRAQMEQAWDITRRRLGHWDAYHEAFAPLERAGLCRRPVVPGECQHNAHMYYLLLPSPAARSRAIAELKGAGIGAIFHYVPLHSSPAGQRYARHHGSMAVTDRVAGTLLRLPMFVTLDADLGAVIDAVRASLGAARAASATVT
jgi:dTDP-4-amino-4,6-dideoxygalactose transaminase